MPSHQERVRRNYETQPQLVDIEHSLVMLVRGYLEEHGELDAGYINDPRRLELLRMKRDMT